MLEYKTWNSEHENNLLTRHLVYSSIRPTKDRIDTAHGAGKKSTQHCLISNFLGMKSLPFVLQIHSQASTCAGINLTRMWELFVQSTWQVPMQLSDTFLGTHNK